MESKRKQFCIECRKETGYKIQKGQCVHTIKGKEYCFDVFKAVCEECGEEINLPGLLDANAALIDNQYRRMENLVSVEDISTVMEVYNLGKAPLSLALGFGEITITRYLQGQYPSKEYSDVIRNSMVSPIYMMKLLDLNREKVGDSAYKKAWNAANDLKELTDKISEKMLIVISYIFEKCEEVTPLALQKLLYYSQVMFLVNCNCDLFDEDCQAWAHGPVYNEVYNLFKEFKYNPIDDCRFIMFKDRFHKLSIEERKVLDLVLNTFGMYSGKTLECISHKEDPWNNAYDPNNVYGYTNEIITKDSIKKYFSRMAKHYDLTCEEGLKKYITDQILNN